MPELIKKDQTTTVGEHGISTFTEYSFKATGLSLGISDVYGRYPTAGMDVDTEIEQMWYVMEGSGTVKIKEQTYELHVGDMLYLAKGDAYIIDGIMKLMIASAPAWTDAQHKHVA